MWASLPTWPDTWLTHLAGHPGGTIREAQLIHLILG
jgi:hypothetical protein